MGARLLDLFCGAGGASMGYVMAGFEVMGVDIYPQPHYPFAFVQADALTFELEGFDVIHASPPCQKFSAYRRRGRGVGATAPDLIGAIRQRLCRASCPYIIENIPSAPLRNPILLCGSSFGLDVRRHRLFESTYLLLSPECQHAWQTPRFAPATNRVQQRRTVEVGVWRIPLVIQQQAMGIDWMTTRELSQAIPPAYTNFIGQQIITLL